MTRNYEIHESREKTASAPVSIEPFRVFRSSKKTYRLFLNRHLIADGRERDRQVVIVVVIVIRQYGHTRDGG